MKIALFLLTFVTFCIYPGKIYAQDAKVTIMQPEITVGDLLTEIEAQTNYLFVYNKKNVDTERKTTIYAENKPVFEILDQVFRGSGIKYIVEGTNIVLTKGADVILQTQQQNLVIIKGTVTDMKGEDIIGANVVEAGTSNGIITDIFGNFTLAVRPDAELQVSFVGYRPLTVSVKGQTQLIIRLEEVALMLESVVVTAMGIKKKEASLTYSAQQIDGNEITRTKESNPIFSLAGKTAGVLISKNSSGLGGSAKVTIRGNRSISGNNQPLYVIDGVPMLNNSNEQANTVIGGIADAGNRDGGDGISNLNPDDIESMSILKGASAAALYGSQAANGVILINTKKGKAGVQKVTFSSNLNFDNAISLPKFQNSYGMHPDEKNSWGEKKELNAYDNLGDFFQTGVSAINSISFTTGNEKVQTYFSYANTTASGVVPKTNQQRHNLNFRETANFFNNRLTLDANINLMLQKVKNRPVSGGFYMNPLVGLYTFPRGEDISVYKKDFEVFDPQRNMPRQNWYTSYQDLEQNPYWLINRAKSDDKRTRAIAALTANLKVTNWLTLQGRGTVDYTQDEFEQRMHATTAPAIAGDNGRYINLNHKEYLFYGDAMALFDRDWADFTFNGAIGTSINSNKVTSLRLDSKTASLYYPNVFTVANIRMTQAAYIDQQIEDTEILQSVFATAQLGWKETLYLDLTARNDWVSTLAYTHNKGFFYPSAGLSWVLSNSLRLPDWISFGKLRASWSKVGNGLPLFISNAIEGSNDIIGAGGTIISYSRAPFDQLKPEMSTSYEFGTEWKLFNHRIDIDLTYYKTNTRNQLFTLPTTAGAWYKFYMVNAGNIQNQGIEISLGAIPTLTNNFSWRSQANFSTNKNKIIKLHPDLKTFVYGDEGFSSSYSMRLVEGGSFGDIYGKAFDRDENGKIQVATDAAGVKQPLIIGEGNTVKVGNCSPDFQLGWSNSLTYKGLNLYFLIDGRFGGKVLSQTEAELDQRGVSKNSGLARDKGYVSIGGEQFDPKVFYTTVGGRSGCTEYYMYDATNIRLRELSLGYTFQRNLLDQLKVFQEIQLSLVGRNLFFISKKAPFDPDTVLSIGNNNQGIDVFGMPSTRSLGFNVKLVF